MNTRFFMKYRATIQRVTRTSDNGGGYSDSWSSSSPNVPCFAWTLGTREVILSGRPGVQNTRVVLMSKSTDIQEGDRLVSVNNRQGVVVFDGPLVVDSVDERPDHLRLLTRRIV
jgi:Phage head-tail joining protein